MLVYKNSFGIILGSSFIHNKATNHSIVYGKHGALLDIDRSYFSYNKGGSVAIFNPSHFLLTNCFIQGNSADYGAGLYVEGHAPKGFSFDTDKLSDILRKFASDKHFTGIILKKVHFHLKHTRMINNCTFVENTAASGGAVFAWNTSLTFKLSHFQNNTAPSTICGGGAVQLFFSPTNIVECTFDGNKAVMGGGIVVFGDSLLIYSSLFINNQAINTPASAGGAIYAHSGGAGNTTLQISNCSFDTNTARGDGGAIFSEMHTVAEEVTFQENVASFGGAVNGNDSNFSNCTFLSNRATLAGGAVAFLGGSRTNFVSTIFKKNTAEAGGAICTAYNGTLICSLCIFQHNTAGSR